MFSNVPLLYVEDKEKKVCVGLFAFLISNHLSPKKRKKIFLILLFFLIQILHFFYLFTPFLKKNWWVSIR